MSIYDDLKKEGITLPKETKLRVKVAVFNLKNSRKRLEAEMKDIVKRARADGRKPEKGQLTKQEKRRIAKLMELRANLNARIFRLGGEKKAPDFDPY